MTTHRFILVLATTLAVGACSSVVRDDVALDDIPAWTINLERRVQPWCPGDCEWAVPFIATYRQNENILVFVGVRHVFTSDNPTIRAVDAGFAAMTPAIVVVEGFPTEMGENPPQIVEHVRRRGSADADQFANGEGAYSATMALSRNIPFIGGEPTRADQVQRLLKKGFTQPEIAFSYLLGGISQSMRAGELSDANDPRLSAAFSDWAAAFADQYKLPAISWEEFADRYRSLYGAEFTTEADPVTRIDGVTQPPPLEALRQADMIVRDEHLLATIQQLLATRKRVLVVYGGSHWTTLSQALERRLSKPTVSTFLE